jgi:hypothetical protein
MRMDSSGMSTQAPTGVFWRPSAALRFERRVSQTAPNIGSLVNILQQAWQDPYSGKVEWRDVPLVEASNER